MQAQNDSIYNMSHSKGIPELPPLPGTAAEDPSELYQLIQQSSYYPFLMQRASWTLAAPFKELCYFRSASDSIANNYTLSARHLKMKDLQKIPSDMKPKNSAGAPAFLSNLEAPWKCRKIPVVDYLDEQFLTPEEQLDMMLQHEDEINQQEILPTESDLERYCYYIHNGIRKDMLAPQPKEVMESILEHIPSHFLANPNLEALLCSLNEEIEDDYHIWLMKNVVDYILMDPGERKRLFIRNIPRSFPQRVIRAPVPWHFVYKETKKWNEEHLFTVNPMMLAVQHLWFTEFGKLRFVRTQEILDGDLPLLPGEFEELIRKHCQEAHEILENRQHFILKGTGYVCLGYIYPGNKKQWMHWGVPQF
uniref:Uncharacterized protein n=1 Tax=Sphaerodactylus townsendi TaxID=933632 RepID=A0ACB8FMI3_9SAUR